MNKVLNWFRNLFRRKPQVIFVIENNLDKPKVRVGWVKKVSKDKLHITVEIPSLGNRKFPCTWDGHNYIIDQFSG